MSSDRPPGRTDVVRLAVVYAWRCPACGADRAEPPLPVDEGDFHPEVVRAVRRRWAIPDTQPIPPAYLGTWPREVTCSACGTGYFTERGDELTNPRDN